ncbi:NAD-dependent epimerase/dehydratase family protein [Sulfitobacter sp. BDSS02]|nr:NAD-dependent epimerase/dehydratase family protein [Sulfitobacter sp. BDSS02]
MTIQRILVLGATGRIGTILRETWAPDMALWQGRREFAVPGGAAPLVFDPISQQQGLIQAGQGCSTVLCLAGAVPGRNDAMEDNIALARAAIHIGAGLGARVLLSSSAAVYGVQQGPLDETTPPRPVADYGRAKLEMEREGARLGAELGVPVTALRIGNIAGIDAILGNWRPGFALDCFPDGRTPRRSYIGPVTLSCVIQSLCRAETLPDLLNLAAPEVIEMGALLDAAGLEWVPRPAPDHAIAEVSLATTRLEGFHPLPPEASLPETMVAEWRAQSR